MMMAKRLGGKTMYDITIIGAGISGIFAAHTLAQGNQKILMIDKGKPLQERICPLDRGESCSCESCAKYIGFGGLGKSEGKYNYTNDFGGNLDTKVGYHPSLKLMEEVDQILCQYGGDQAAMYSTENPLLARKAKQAGFEVLTTKVRHLGTNLSETVLQRIFVALQTRIQFMFDTEVKLIHKDNDYWELVTPNQGSFYSRKVIIATGRSGNEWLSAQCASLGISQNFTRVDLGIRLEMRSNQLDAILQDAFETKLQYAGEGFTATTYCMNPQGRVIRKYQDGLVMADGQNYREQLEGSSNLNFTLFIPNYFSSVHEANQHSHSIIGGINQGRERIVAQRLGDLRKGQATKLSDMSQNSVRPTLEAEAGNLLQEVPGLYTQSLLKFLEALEQVLEEPIDEDTILYGLDGKFYAPRIETSDTFETSAGNLFVIGDCSGVTHSLSQAAASGVYVGQNLMNT
jgi:uncharacterized FAD-dependent dehydrogenase